MRAADSESKRSRITALRPIAFGRRAEFVVRVLSAPHAAITFTRLETWPSARKIRRLAAASGLRYTRAPNLAARSVTSNPRKWKPPPVR
jgi:hypothetical protein